jgi:hypothetical protein
MPVTVEEHEEDSDLDGQRRKIEGECDGPAEDEEWYRDGGGERVSARPDVLVVTADEVTRARLSIRLLEQHDPVSLENDSREFTPIRLEWLLIATGKAWVAFRVTHEP